MAEPMNRAQRRANRKNKNRKGKLPVARPQRHKRSTGRDAPSSNPHHNPSSRHRG